MKPQRDEDHMAATLLVAAAYVLLIIFIAALG